MATIAAIDKIDPFRRKSDADRTLLAMGVSNLASSLVGGLTIIPNGVKSTACIVAGGRTQWANFYNASFLIFYLLVGRGVINLMPYSVLGAIIIFTGYKLCAPRVWKHAAYLGIEQLFVFTVTVVVTISTDLLIGILSGVAAKLVVEAFLLGRVVRIRPPGGLGVGAARRWFGRTGELFRNPVFQSRADGDTYHLYFGGPLVCFNAMHLDRALAGVPRESTSVMLHVSPLVPLVDHTAITNLLTYVDDFHRTGRGVAQILGLEGLRKRSHHPAGLRVGSPVFADERAEALRERSQLSLASLNIASGTRDSIDFLVPMRLTRTAGPLSDATETAGAIEQTGNIPE